MRVFDPPGTDSRIHTLTLVRPLLVLHRLTNSHSHARASASRTAQTHEFTLSCSCVRFSRCKDSRVHTLTLVRPTRVPQLHSFTLSSSRALLAMRRFADSLCHACAPGLSHALTFSRSCAWPVPRRLTHSRSHAPVPGLSSTDSRTHVLTLLVPGLSSPGLTHSCSHVLTLARPSRMDSRLFKYSGFHFRSLICLAFTDAQRTRVPGKLAWRACFFIRLRGMYVCTFCSLLPERF